MLKSGDVLLSRYERAYYAGQLFGADPYHNMAVPLALHNRGVMYSSNTNPNSWERLILCRRLKRERGIVRVRVAFVPRFTEIKPLFLESLTFLSFFLHTGKICGVSGWHHLIL